jgi:hypothetical protein
VINTLFLKVRDFSVWLSRCSIYNPTTPDGSLIWSNQRRIDKFVLLRGRSSQMDRNTHSLITTSVKKTWQPGYNNFARRSPC